jgi:hypothetical protein
MQRIKDQRQREVTCQETSVISAVLPGWKLKWVGKLTILALKLFHGMKFDKKVKSGASSLYIVAYGRFVTGVCERCCF